MTALIQIGAGWAAMAVVLSVTLAIVCFCCTKSKPKCSHASAAQQEFGELWPVTPFGPMPYVPGNDREQEESEPLEILIIEAPTASCDVTPSNPYDTPI
jgi:hypothetical protein